MLICSYREKNMVKSDSVDNFSTIRSEINNCENSHLMEKFQQKLAYYLLIYFCLFYSNHFAFCCFFYFFFETNLDFFDFDRKNNMI